MQRHQHTPLYVRIDNRLLHGQIVQFWIPYLEVDRLIIADDDAASNSTMASVYRMAIPNRIVLVVTTIAELQSHFTDDDPSTTLVIMSDVYDAARSKMCEFSFERLTLGNVHAAEGRRRVTDSVYLSSRESEVLGEFVENGFPVEIQTFPGETLNLEPDGSGGYAWSKR